MSAVSRILRSDSIPLSSRTKEHPDDYAGWTDFALRGDHSLHCVPDPRQVLFLDYEPQTDPGCKTLLFLGENARGKLAEMVKGGQQRLGFLTESHIVLRLQVAIGGQTGKLVVVPIGRIDQLLTWLFSQNPLTQSEKKTLLQIVCGYTLKDAAICDDLSYETKRVQAKSLLKKSRMKRQIDLSSYVIAHLLTDTAVASRIDTSFDVHKSFAHYVQQFLPKSVRSHTRLGTNGRYTRFLDMGPETGRPFILLHSHILPFMTAADVAWLSEKNMRLIWPLRNGTLGPDDGYIGFQQHVDHAIGAIELARDLFCERFAAIVTLGCAVHYGIAHAERYPDTSERYVFIGANTSQARKVMSSNSLSNSENFNSLRANYFLSLVGDQLIDRSHLRKLLLQAYASSPADIAAVDREFDDTSRSNALMFQFTRSEISTKHDCSFHIAPEWALAKTIDQPVHLIHGDADGIDDLEEIRRLAASIGGELTVIKNAGQLLAHSHTRQCLTALNEATKLCNVIVS